MQVSECLIRTTEYATYERLLTKNNDVGVGWCGKERASLVGYEG